MNSLSHEEGVSAGDLFLSFARHSKIIILTSIIFCIASAIYVNFYSKPIYTSTSKIMSSSESSGVSQALGLATQFGINLPTGKSEPKWSYLEIIRSRTLSRSLLKRKINVGNSEEKTLLQILTSDDEKSKIYNHTLETKAVDKLLKMINVSENLKTSVYTLSINSNDPQLSALINKFLIEELDIHREEYHKVKTSETRKFIQDRILETEKELIRAEEILKNFMDRNRRIENSPMLLLEQQRLSREVTVLIGVFTTLKQQLETSKIEEVKESDRVVVLDPPEIPFKRSKPNKKLIIIISTFFGFGLGTFWGFIKEFVQNSEKAEHDKIQKAKKIIYEDIFKVFRIR
jgi:uncharacterized protein involved in exopolysaccharide biosynthesis